MSSTVTVPSSLILRSKAGFSTLGLKLGSLKGQTVNLGDILPKNLTWLPGPLPPKPLWLFWQPGHKQHTRGWAELSSWLL